MLALDVELWQAYQKNNLKIKWISEQMPNKLDLSIFFLLSSQGKRDESTNVDSAKAKADAKVNSLHLSHSLWSQSLFFCLFFKQI